MSAQSFSPISRIRRVTQGAPRPPQHSTVADSHSAGGHEALRRPRHQHHSTTLITPDETRMVSLASALGHGDDSLPISLCLWRECYA